MPKILLQDFAVTGLYKMQTSAVDFLTLDISKTSSNHTPGIYMYMCVCVCVCTTATYNFFENQFMYKD
jgi:hypothetical protein